MLVAAAAALTTVVAFGQLSNAAGPVGGNPIIDGARQGLAAYLSGSQAPIGDGDLALRDCPILTEDAFVSPLAFFGPAEGFDSYTGEFTIGGGTDGTDVIGLTCEAERGFAPQGGVLSGGVAAWDLAGNSEILTYITEMQYTSDDLGDHDLLDGEMYGYCEDRNDAYECYQFWTSDGFVLGMYVGFESEDSQKDPLNAVGQLLGGHLPGLLANVSGLTAVPGLSTPEATVAPTSTIPLGGK